MAGLALWNLGFRPFYLLASVFSASSVLLWAAQYSGLLPFAYLQGPLWHGHEMLFGYTMAVVAGFLLTAVRAWTGQPTPTGVPLMVLALRRPRASYWNMAVSPGPITEASWLRASQA